MMYGPPLEGVISTIDKEEARKKCIFVSGENTTKNTIAFRRFFETFTSFFVEEDHAAKNMFSLTQML